MTGGFKWLLNKSNENERKQKAKIFDMEQMSKKHGDNFAVKLKKKTEVNKEVNYSINDFSEKDIIGEYKKYVLNKNCIIFNRLFDNEPLEIELYKNIEMSEYIAKINSYIYWLGENCKKDMIKYYNKGIAIETEEDANDEWYEELEVFSVSITVSKNGKLGADITCGDNYWTDHILDIETIENKIFSMNYDG
jgi:hypothetical protein